MIAVWVVFGLLVALLVLGVGVVIGRSIRLADQGGPGPGTASDAPGARRPPGMPTRGTTSGAGQSAAVPTRGPTRGPVGGSGESSAQPVEVHVHHHLGRRR